MSFEGLGKRLVFWDKEADHVISKFLSDIVPHVGQLWKVPLGSHQYNHERGTKKVRVLEVEINPLGEGVHIDIDITCEVVED